MKVKEEDLYVGNVLWDSHYERECWVQLESVTADGVWTGMYETADFGTLNPEDLRYTEQPRTFAREDES